MQQEYLYNAMIPPLMMERTQVIPNAFAEGVLITQRAMHSTHVSALAGNICLNLNLINGKNIEYFTAVQDAALLHDVGHPPFGHKGEEVLNDILKQFGGSFSHGSFAPDEAKRQKRSDLTVLLLESKRDETVQVAKIVHDWADDIAWVTTDLEDGSRLGYLDVSQKEVVSLEVVQKAVRLAKEMPVYKHEEGFNSTWNLWWVTEKLSNIFVNSIRFYPQNIDENVPILDKGKVLNGNFLMTEPAYSEFNVLKKILSEQFYHHPLINEFYKQVPELIRTVFNERFKNSDLENNIPLEVAKAVCLSICSLSEHELAEEYKQLSGKTIESCKTPLAEVPEFPGAKIAEAMFLFDL